VLCLAVSGDGRALAATGGDGSVWLRRLRSAPPAAIGTRPRPQPTSAARGVIGSSQRLFDWLRRVALL